VASERSILCLSWCRQLRQTKVQNLCVPAPSDKDIGWLNVPMNDALRMRCIESIGHLYAQIEDLFNIQRLASNQVLKRLSLQQLVDTAP
jgi:hypothetical protein